MHKCVCIWQYILQNYNYKLHFQNLSIYNVLHVFIGTLATENLDVCTACDSWDSNIQLTMVKDRRWQRYSNVVQCLTLTLGAKEFKRDSKCGLSLCWPFIKLVGLLSVVSPFFSPILSWVVGPRGWEKGMRRGGLFISARVFFPVWCHPWMDGGTDGWMDEKNFTKNDHDVLYY
jgi:hypothetical protein